MGGHPKWLLLGEEVTDEAIAEALRITQHLDLGDLQVKPIPFMAACHLNACLTLSIDGNKRGWHSASICLLRQCVEVLTIVDISL
jgi:hypothetical protein